jgi:ATP-dependent phosphofructokinase / diphosphate-dependent phosphofructokinase
VEFAVAGKNGIMPAIRRLSDALYRLGYHRGTALRCRQSGKLLPADFISPDGFGITEAARRYLAPLIVGEAYPPFENGLPDCVKPQQSVRVPQKLGGTFAV